MLRCLLPLSFFRIVTSENWSFGQFLDNGPWLAPELENACVSFSALSNLGRVIALHYLWFSFGSVWSSFHNRGHQLSAGFFTGVWNVDITGDGVPVPSRGRSSCSPASFCWRGCTDSLSSWIYNLFAVLTLVIWDQKSVGAIQLPISSVVLKHVKLTISTVHLWVIVGTLFRRM